MILRVPAAATLCAIANATLPMEDLPAMDVVTVLAILVVQETVTLDAGPGATYALTQELTSLRHFLHPL